MDTRQKFDSERLVRLRNYLLAKKHHAFRKELPENLAEQYHSLELSPEERMTRRFEYLASEEAPVILPDELIVFTRTVKNIPECFTEAEWDEIRSKHFIHERGYISNYSPDYEKAIKEGLLSLREGADSFTSRVIDAIISLARRYRDEALRVGRNDVAEILSRVPEHGAESFREALQMFRILHFSLWLEGNYHVTCGRFDQYVYPYLKADLESGALCEDDALILLRDFFLSFNKDSDTYVGVQQGDNGQSMVLGGVDSEGNEAFNLLSRLCLEASCANRLIDPKINLRVSKKTPLEIFELGSKLTAAGLGFPQYSNDDIVIEGLTRLGYDLVNARNYAVAACWEFIIPKYGVEIPNIGAMSYPKALDIALHSGKDFPTYESFENAVFECINDECGRITGSINNLWSVPSPLMNSLITPKYHNFGIHGTGIATAADSLAAIRRYVYDEKRFTLDELVRAVDDDFDGSPELLHLLRYDAPKMGQNDDFVDSIACKLLASFSASLRGRVNCVGGGFRAGTGTAMYYLWHAAELGASPDGRRKGEPFGTNFSPSLFAPIRGPFSVISSFTKPEFADAVNGGPLTVEFSSSMFSDDDAIRKTALFVRSFIKNGGHQLQLNAVNIDDMKDAQKNPGLHRQLIVRVWGWSAYFTELDREYQDHVISRQEYSV